MSVNIGRLKFFAGSPAARDLNHTLRIVFRPRRLQAVQKPLHHLSSIPPPSHPQCGSILAHNYARVFSYRRSTLMQRLWSLIEAGLNRPDSAIAITAGRAAIRSSGSSLAGSKWSLNAFQEH